MKTRLLLQKLKGVHTIESIKDILKVEKDKAIYYVYRLRKQGYVKTKRLSNNVRLYDISFENKLKGISYYDIINKYSPIKIATPKTYMIYGKEPTIEETLIFAIKTKSLRTILASLALFRKVEDWSLLYRLAKKNHLERQVGALYDLTRTLIKIRKMTKRFRHNALPKEEFEFKYTVPGLKSKDFTEIEKTWKIYVPFNKEDMEVYTT